MCDILCLPMFLSYLEVVHGVVDLLEACRRVLVSVVLVLFGFRFRRCFALFTVFCDFWLCPERSEGRNFFGLLISVVYPELEKKCKNNRRMCVSVISDVMAGLVESFQFFTCFVEVIGREATKNFLCFFHLSE